MCWSRVGGVIKPTAVMFWKCLFKVTDTDVQCFGQFGFEGFFISHTGFVFFSKITDPIGRDFLLKHTKNP